MRLAPTLPGPQAVRMGFGFGWVALSAEQGRAAWRKQSRESPASLDEPRVEAKDRRNMRRVLQRAHERGVVMQPQRFAEPVWESFSRLVTWCFATERAMQQKTLWQSKVANITRRGRCNCCAHDHVWGFGSLASAPVERVYLATGHAFGRPASCHGLVSDRQPTTTQFRRCHATHSRTHCAHPPAALSAHAQARACR